MKNANHAKRKLHIGTVLSIVVCALTFTLLLYFVLSLFDCRSYFDNEAKTLAQSYTVQQATSFQTGLAGQFDAVSSIAARVSDVTGIEALDAAGAEAVAQYGLPCLQFLKDGEAEYRFGEYVGSSTASEVVRLVNSRAYGCSSIYNDLSLGVSTVAVFAPIEGNDAIDGVLAYYAVSETVKGGGLPNEFARLYAFTTQDGAILDSESAEGFPTDVSHNIFTYLYNLTESKSVMDAVQQNAQAGVSGAYRASIAGEEYMISSAVVRSFGTNCFVFNVFPVNELLQNEYTLYDRMTGAMVGIVVLVLVALIAFVVVKYRSDAQMIILDEYDPVLGCNTYNKFLRDSTGLLTTNHLSNYAALYITINKFEFIKEHLGSETGDAIIRYVSTVVKKTVTTNETYGHMSDDRFVILEHFSDLQQLSDRIRILDALISNFEKTKASNVALRISVGVYVVDHSRELEIQEMIDRAIIAQRVNAQMPDRPFTIYDDSIQSSYLHEAEIESKMDFALKNREFKVFFQPKYNIAHDRIDGAEALVRWYDETKKAYVGPDEFVPLFEINGFISRVDQYVFTEVCSYLKEATVRGERVVPISINVSRVTATQPNFVADYVRIKREYGIADEFLTIEFTESFAYENYDTLAGIVNHLKKNGFKCSIDDFGSGYSSFNILKELPMDELKLDRFFLKAGADSKKDETLLRTMIQMGRSFGMKVTQEGIESMEEMRRLQEYGCDVIQGYYYSRPLPMSDFIDFVARETSLVAVAGQHQMSSKARQPVTSP